MSVQTKRLVTQWFEQVWVQRDVGAIDRLMVEGATVQLEGIDGPVTRSELKEYCRAFQSAVPDLVVEIDLFVCEGEKCVALWRLSGTHSGYGIGIPPTGRRVDIRGVSIFIVAGGRVVSGFDRWNRGELLAKLLEARPAEASGGGSLTAREREVAILMSDRLTHTEISRRLGIAPNTARRHCERVMVKLGVTRRSDVARSIGRVSATVLNRHGADLVSMVRTV
ncbi:MAG: ester cyclase [Gemmatimonadaceae bacterium]